MLDPEKIAKALRDELEKKFVGTKNTEAIKAEVESATRKMLDEMSKVMFSAPTFESAGGSLSFEGLEEATRRISFDVSIPVAATMPPGDLEKYKKLLEAGAIDTDELRKMILGEFPMDVPPPPDNLFEKDFMDELKNL